MPKPRKNEKKDEYISRCISYVMEKEGKPKKEAIGKCYGMWNNHKGG